LRNTKIGKQTRRLKNTRKKKANATRTKKGGPGETGEGKHRFRRRMKGNRCEKQTDVVSVSVQAPEKVAGRMTEKKKKGKAIRAGGGIEQLRRRGAVYGEPTRASGEKRQVHDHKGDDRTN